MVLTGYTTQDIAFVTTSHYFETRDLLLISKTEDTDMAFSIKKKDFFTRFVIERKFQTTELQSKPNVVKFNKINVMS
jgi:hypothetical protein